MRPGYLLALLPALPAVLAGTAADPPAGVAREFTPEWEFEPFPGQKVVLNGTVEQVIAALGRVNPTYSPFAAAPADRGSSLGRRRRPEVFPRDRVICKIPGWGGVDVNKGLAGVRYLQKVKGQPGAGPGPGSCGRVSCGYRAAVFFCNDNTHGITIESFAKIAEMANIIQYYCLTGINPFFNGRAFHPTENWNVIVRAADC